MDLIDLEEIIIFHEIDVQKENVDSLRSSEDSLSTILDKMCETLDVGELEKINEKIEKRPNDLYDLELGGFGISNEDFVFKDDRTSIEKKYGVHVEDKISDDSIKPNSCILYDFDEKEAVGNITDDNDRIANIVEANKTDACTDDAIVSPTALALAEFNEIYKTACLASDNLQKSTGTKIIGALDEQYDYETINLDEFGDILNENCNEINETCTDDIDLDEVVENGNDTKLAIPEIDLVDVIDEENAFTIDTDAVNKDKNNNPKNENYRNTIENDIAVIKEALKDTERSHVLKTVEIDITNDDIISLSSTESDDGYNSSDFEFITEDEAKKAGITVEGNKKADIEPNKAGNNSLPDHIKYHRNRYLRCRVENYKSKLESHAIPDADSLISLFRTLPIVNGVYYSTNKHVLSAKNMAFNTDGFEFNFPDNNEENSKFKDEAKETAKKIAFLYPLENRKRRRFY